MRTGFPGTIVVVLVALMHGDAYAASSRATTRISITKTAPAAPVIPLVVPDRAALDLAGLRAWSASVGASLVTSQIESLPGEPGTELIMITFE